MPGSPFQDQTVARTSRSDSVAQVRSAAPEKAAASLLIEAQLAAELPLQGLIEGKQAERLKDLQLKELAKKASVDPVLSLSDLLSVDSVSGLKARYAHHGLSFASGEAFLEQVRNDWWAAKKMAWDKAGAVGGYAEKLPCIELNVEGRAIRLFTVVHGVKKIAEMGPAYLETVQRTCEGNKLLGEMGMHIYGAKTVADMPDHLVFKPGQALKLGLLLGLLTPRLAFLKRNITETICKYLVPFKTDTTPEEVSRRATHFPAALQGDLPAYLRLENYSGRYEIFSKVTRRSAYHAEFLRAAVRRGLEVDGVIGGMSHIPEIAYFLDHPLGDKAIEAKAEKHVATLAQKGPKEFATSWLPEYVKQVALPQLAGTLAGYGAYVVGAWGMIKLGLSFIR